MNSLRNQENFTAQSLFNNMNTQCSKKNDIVTSLSNTAEPRVEINLHKNFRMEAKIERSLTAKSSVERFHLCSQMSLMSWFPENFSSIFDSKNIMSNFLTYTDDVAEFKKNNTSELQQIK